MLILLTVFFLIFLGAILLPTTYKKKYVYLPYFSGSFRRTGDQNGLFAIMNLIHIGNEQKVYLLYNAHNHFNFRNI